MKKQLAIFGLLGIVAVSSVNFNVYARRGRGRHRKDVVTDLGNGRIEVCRKVGSSRGSRAGKGLLFGGLTGAAIGGAAGGGRGAGIGAGVGALTGATIGAASGDDEYECYVTTEAEYYGARKGYRR